MTAIEPTVNKRIAAFTAARELAISGYRKEATRAKMTKVIEAIELHKN